MKFVDEKFWMKVNYTETCWLWTGTRYPTGYGRVRFRGKWGGAHRAAWILMNGDLDPQMCICHHCDNPPCVRPDHLFIGTRKDNLHDAIRKGRWKPDPERSRQLGYANRGKKASLETRRKMSATRFGKKGKPHTKETKDKLSQLRRGKKFGPLSAQHKEKLSAAWDKRRLLAPHIPGEETRKKMRESHANHPRDKSGKFLPFGGGISV